MKEWCPNCKDWLRWEILPSTDHSGTYYLGVKCNDCGFKMHATGLLSSMDVAMQTMNFIKAALHIEEQEDENETNDITIPSNTTAIS